MKFIALCPVCDAEMNNVYKAYNCAKCNSYIESNSDYYRYMMGNHILIGNKANEYSETLLCDNDYQTLITTKYIQLDYDPDKIMKAYNKLLKLVNFS